MAVIESTIRLRDRFSSTLQRMSRGLNNASVGMQRLANSNQILNQRTNLAGSGVNRLTRSLGRLSASYLAVGSAQSLIAMGDAYIGNTARIDLMNDGLQTTAELQDKIYKASQRSLMDYNKMSATVSKLGITAKHAFNNNDEMIAFAELVNKQFAISGASQSERSNAMYQLTQAMASGRLQGDEFRSILENAPMLAQTIAESMGQPFEKMKELSADGLITADVIKKALFSTAVETNTKFNNMPMQFGDLWIQVSNKINRGLEPIYVKLKQMWNNSDVQSFFDIFANSFVMLLRTGLTAFNVLSSATAFFAKNWSVIEPIVWGATTALTIYFATLSRGLLASAAQWAISTYNAIAYQVALFKMAVAQYGFNTALAMCPLSWFLYAIIAIVSVFYLAVAAVNKFAGTSYSATGMIAGAFSALGAFLWNLFLGFAELVVGVFQGLINPIISFVNFFANVWTNPISSVINLFHSLADNALGVLQRIASAMDFVFGSSMADTVSGWRNDLKGLSENAIKKYAPDENYKEIVSKMDFSMGDMAWAKRLEYGESYKTGYDWGSDLTSDLKKKFKMGENITDFNGNDLGHVGTAMKNANMPMLDELKKIAGNTKSSASSLVRNNEDMSYLRQLAERDTVNKYTTNTIKVEMTNNNKVSSKVDMDKIIDHLGEKVYDTMLSTAEGVHI